MTFIQARNRITSRLEAHIGCPVVLSGRITDVPDFPYCYYSVLTPRMSSRFFGLHELKMDEGKFIRIRSEQVTATMSFTFCSMDRETETGYIFGEDEALTLSEKAHGFFLLDAHNISTENGDIVMNTVGTVANRAGFFVEDTIRRYGFDVKFSYVRTDETPTATILNPGTPKGNAHSGK